MHGSQSSGGFSSNPSGEHFDGILDEIRIYDYALSADWIKTSYNNVLNPGSYLTVGSLLNSTITDYSGHEHHGTAYGNTTYDAGKYDTSLIFDGSEDWVDLGDIDL